MISYAHGLVYCVVLDQKIDKYDIIPDLMTKTRRDWSFIQDGFIDGNPVSFIIIVTQKESDNRLIHSKFYKNNMQNWHKFDSRSFDSLCTHGPNLIDNMSLTDEENERLQIILKHTLIKDNIHSKYLPGWYDQHYME